MAGLLRGGCTLELPMGSLETPCDRTTPRWIASESLGGGAGLRHQNLQNYQCAAVLKTCKKSVLVES